MTTLVDVDNGKYPQGDVHEECICHKLVVSNDVSVAQSEVRLIIYTDEGTFTAVWKMRLDAM